jgi:hypothetical protein
MAPEHSFGDVVETGIPGRRRVQTARREGPPGCLDRAENG